MTSKISPQRINSITRVGRFIIQNYLLMFYVRFMRYNKIYEKGKVTIITPTHNRLNELKDAIDSVSNQTYTNWEHIIVADGYDDNVRALICYYNDPRVKYYYTMKLNVMGNYQRNYALKHAGGEYVLYLDDDNILEENCLEVMVNGFSSEEVGYVICPIKYGNTIMNPRPGFKHREIDLLNYMVRRKLIEKVWGQNRHIAADYYLINKLRQITEGNYLEDIIGHHR